MSEAIKANPSERWKNEMVDLVQRVDFKYDRVYDAGRTFRQDDHQCDFCGAHLRYTAVVHPENDEEDEYRTGLDCLEHLMGTKWSRLQEVEREIEELKEEAARKRRKEAYAEEWSGVIKWIRKYLDIAPNNFLEEMYDILTTGKEEFTRNMEERVKEIYQNTDLEELEERQKEKERKIAMLKPKMNKILNLVAEIDGVKTESSNRSSIYSESVYTGTYDFVHDVYRDFKYDGTITDNQMEALNDVYEEYKEKKESGFTVEKLVNDFKKLRNLVAEVDDVDQDKSFITNKTYKFVKSVGRYAQNNGKITENQKDPIEDIAEEYQGKVEEDINFQILNQDE